MLLKEYIQEQLRVVGVEIPDSLITAEMKSLNADNVEVANNLYKAQEVIYSIIPIILIHPNSVSEGGYSISYDKESLLKYYSILAKRLGRDDLLNKEATVKDITDKW